MSSLSFLFLIATLTIVVDYGEPLECFSCSSYENGTCGSEFNRTASRIEPCCAACNSCVKARIVTPENKTVILRSCGTEYHCKLYDRQGCHVCSKNLCNESSHTAAHPFLYCFTTCLSICLIVSIL